MSRASFGLFFVFSFLLRCCFAHLSYDWRRHSGGGSVIGPCYCTVHRVCYDLFQIKSSSASTLTFSRSILTSSFRSQTSNVSSLVASLATTVIASVGVTTSSMISLVISSTKHHSFPLFPTWLMYVQFL